MNKSWVIGLLVGIALSLCVYAGMAFVGMVAMWDYKILWIGNWVEGARGVFAVSTLFVVTGCILTAIEAEKKALAARPQKKGAEA